MMLSRKCSPVYDAMARPSAGESLQEFALDRACELHIEIRSWRVTIWFGTGNERLVSASQGENEQRGRTIF